MCSLVCDRHTDFAAPLVPAASMQKALTDGNTEGGLDINAPRQSDGVRRTWID